MPSISIVIKDWSYGLWTTGPASKAPQGALTRCTNMTLTEKGSIKTRYGTTRLWNIANTSDGRLVGTHHIFKANFDETTWSGDIYEDDINLGFTQEGRRIRAAAVPTIGVATDNIYFSRAMKKYDGTTVSNWGISDVITGVTLSVIAIAGNLNGTYYYVLVFYNSTTRTVGVVSAPFGPITPALNKVKLSNIPIVSTDPQVDKVRIYRTLAGIPGTYYFIDEIDLGFDSYTDNISDLGVGDILNTNVVTVPTITEAVGRYQNRLLASGVTDNPRYIYFSDSGYPENFTATSLEQVLDAGDTPEAIMQVGDYGYVFGQTGLYTVQITAAGVVYTTKILAGQGTINGRSVWLGSEGIYYLASDGLYSVTGFNPKKLSVTVDSVFRKIDRGGLSYIKDSVAHPNKYISGTYIYGIFYLTYLGEDDIWHTLIYDETQNGRWEHHTGWLYVTPPQTGMYPIVGLPNSVALQNVNVIGEDDGVAIQSTCGFNLTLEQTALVDIRRFRISMSCVGTVNVAFYDDGVLMYNIDIVNPTFNDGWQKDSLPLGTYFTQPEVVLTSNSVFELRSFEAQIDVVRKDGTDYTRQQQFNSANA